MGRQQSTGERQDEVRTSEEVLRLRSSPYAAPITTGGGMVTGKPTSTAGIFDSWAKSPRLGNNRPPAPRINFLGVQPSNVASQGSLQSSISTVPDSSTCSSGISTLSTCPGSKLVRNSIAVIDEAEGLREVDTVGDLAAQQEAAPGSASAANMTDGPTAPTSPFGASKEEGADEADGGGLSNDSDQATCQQAHSWSLSGDILAGNSDRRRRATRESARRVRYRRLKELGDMERNVRDLAAQNAQLVQQAEEASAARESLITQHAAMDVHLHQVQEEKAALQQQKHILEQRLQALPTGATSHRTSTQAEMPAPQAASGITSAFSKTAKEPFFSTQDRPGSSPNLTGRLHLLHMHPGLQQDEKMSENVLSMFPSLSLSLPSRLDSMEFVDSILDA